MHMGNYRRNFRPGGVFFFTVVSNLRMPILTTDLARPILRESILSVQQKWPFEILGIVLLPDHLHSIWMLPDNDSDFSLRCQKIKEQFTRGWLASGGQEKIVSKSNEDHGQRGVWQRRFWEHTCRNEEDLNDVWIIYTGTQLNMD